MMNGVFRLFTEPSIFSIEKQGEYFMGSYVHNNLISGEQVVYEARLHWIIFFSFRSVFTLLILPLIDRWTSEFAITNKRVIMKVGLIRRKALEMNLSKIESVNVDQTIMGRIFGYGTVTIIGTGGTRESFHRISKPMEFRRVFQEQQG
jgi:uncharacterized membrane protein YdbT with pleckstrin-like domain